MRKTLRHPVASARRFLRSPAAGRFLRYSFVSVVSTVVSLGGLYFFFRVVKIGTAAESNLLATSIASIPAYYLNRTWSWGKTGRSHLFREVIPFWTISAVGVALSTGAVHLASVEAHQVNLGHRGVTLVVEGANFATYGILWIGKFLIFNRFLFRVEPTPAPQSAASLGETVADRPLPVLEPLPASEPATVMRAANAPPADPVRAVDLS